MYLPLFRQCTDQSFPLKLGYVDPDMYLGAVLDRTRLHNGVCALALSPNKYIHKAARNIKAHLRVNYSGGYRRPMKNLLALEYDLKMDVSPEVSPDAASYL